MEHTHRRTDTRLVARQLVALFSLLLLVIAFSDGLRAQTPAYSFASQLGATGSDIGRSVATDANGNMYVTGTFDGTVDFDPGAGTANLTAGDTGDVFLAKYTASGNYVWAFRIGGVGVTPLGGGRTNEGFAVAVDASGNVCVTGRFQGTADFDPGAGVANLTRTGTLQQYGDMFVARYTTTGAYLWAFAIPDAWSNAIAVDGNGNAVVTGGFNGSVDFNPGSQSTTLKSTRSGNGSGDMFVARYSASGTFLWAFRCGNDGAESAHSLVIDGGGNIYVAGHFSGAVGFNPASTKSKLTSAGSDDIFVARYTSAGTYSWAFRVGGTGGDEGNALAIDGNGNVVVTGSFNGTADFNPGTATANLTSAGGADIFVARYSASGSYLWAIRAGGTGGEEGSSVAVDGSGNSYVTGYFNGTVDFDPGAGTASLTAVASSILVAAYDASGAYLWAFAAGGPAGGTGTGSNGNSIAVDGSGDVVVTGSFRTTVDFDPGSGTASFTSAGGYDGFIAKYTQITQPKRSFGESASDLSSIVEMRTAPNPFTGSFRFGYAGSTLPAHIQLIDMMGQVVESHDVTSNNGEIDLGRELPAGVYIVQIVHGERREQRVVRKLQ